MTRGLPLLVHSQLVNRRVHLAPQAPELLALLDGQRIGATT